MTLEEFNVRVALSTIISIPHRGSKHPYTEISEWLDAKCHSFTHATYGSTANYHFTNKQDAVLFTLRWA